eukprot:TRINITY_DN6669_c1_g3_i2.p1 TRINITY_DN6669_c1_g3~~TRINITY_DN6669_c1_g3_i2.p1  ORF type:complete len:371 (+),score=77.90 TRINITY_DN6669_c1_g3_i2:435-1547(+)
MHLLSVFPCELPEPEEGMTGNTILTSGASAGRQFPSKQAMVEDLSSPELDQDLCDEPEPAAEDMTEEERGSETDVRSSSNIQKVPESWRKGTAKSADADDDAATSLTPAVGAGTPPCKPQKSTTHSEAELIAGGSTVKAILESVAPPLAQRSSPGGRGPLPPELAQTKLDISCGASLTSKVSDADPSCIQKNGSSSAKTSAGPCPRRQARQSEPVQDLAKLHSEQKCPSTVMAETTRHQNDEQEKKDKKETPFQSHSSCTDFASPPRRQNIQRGLSPGSHSKSSWHLSPGMSSWSPAESSHLMRSLWTDGASEAASLSTTATVRPQLASHIQKPKAKWLGHLDVETQRLARIMRGKSAARSSSRSSSDSN